MLSTITAAETQFRHEDAQRRRERSLLARIGERRAAESRAADAARVQGAGRRVTPVSWARPIRPVSSARAATACA